MQPDRHVYGLAVIPYVGRRALCAIFGHRWAPVSAHCSRCGESRFAQMAHLFNRFAGSAYRARAVAEPALWSDHAPRTVKTDYVHFCR